LIAIGEILHSNIDQSTLEKIFDNLEPVWKLMFKEEGLDYINEAAVVFNVIIFKTKTISEKMWLYFPLYCYII